MAKLSERKTNTKRPSRISGKASKTVRRRPLWKRNLVAKRKPSSGARLLMSGQSRAALRKRAAILAAELERDLYCIDLSRVAGKFIGETEKNLARIFDAAAATGAVLLFDEADALFGKRTDVKDSHDRYANQEVNYLLQRIEAHTGVVILAGNQKSNLDEAFLRRFRFISATKRPVPVRR